MEALGIAANVIAVVGLTAQVLSLCQEYVSNVKNAQEDIERLINEVEALRGVLTGVENLVTSRDGTELSTLGSLDEPIKQCSAELERIKTRLTPKPLRKAMSRVGIRALKWPFKKGAVDRSINDLQRYKMTLSIALIVDQGL